MSDTTQIQGTAASQSDVILEVCQQNKAEPEAIWDALDAKGVETTPGVIFQAMSAAEHAPAPKAADGAGLQADDLAILGTLAAKAGGVEQLIRILSVWHDTPR
jgi:hypothetical protein